MSDHNQGYTLSLQLPEKLHNLGPGLGVQGPGWFVC